MKITEVDSQSNLYLIENFYSQELVGQFIAIDHLAASWKKEEWQDQYPRRRLTYEPNSIYQLLDQYTKKQLGNLSGAIGLELMACDTGFWLDEAGFCMTPHFDNDGVKVSMQIYLNENDSKLGTAFYNTDNTVRYTTKYLINTGYLMINGPDQMHGMGVPVPASTYRISSYTWFYPKE